MSIDSPVFLTNAPISDDPMEALEQVADDVLRLCDQPLSVCFDMGMWCAKADDSSVCYVCLAGAIIYRRLPHANQTSPNDYPDEIRDKLYAFNCLRDSIYLYLTEWPIAHDYVCDEDAFQDDWPNLIGRMGTETMRAFAKRLKEIAQILRTDVRYHVGAI